VSPTGGVDVEQAGHHPAVHEQLGLAEVAVDGHRLVLARVGGGQDGGQCLAPRP
jgi:hypothetical protein